MGGAGKVLRGVRRVVSAGLVAMLLAGMLHVASPLAAAALPAGFTETVAISGLVDPTNVEFAADGRVFVTEKSGAIKVFDNLSDPTPTTFSALQTNVHNFWDRGLLGLALDPSLTNPNLPLRPWVYVLYTYDHILGSASAPPRWGDTCPNPPGATTDGCVVSGRLSRFSVSGSAISGPETVLIEDWCQQFPSHSVGALGFGPDGALYVSGGDGSNFNAVDYGQFGGSSGSPVSRNPCGDPPGGTMAPPTAEGGSLRSQDLRTTADPTTLDGAILRVDPVSGAAFAGNPFISDPDPNKRRIIASGLRNPFRFELRPGTNELWLGDVGWNSREEINRIANTGDAVVENFGWPCYEGTARQSGYDNANLSICENLYAAGSGAITAPVYAYQHGAAVVAGESCPNGSSAIAGMAFYPENGGTFPAAYHGGLFFADHERDCIWWMAKGTNGQPDPATRQVFQAPANNPVDLEIGPDGSLYYVDLEDGNVRRIAFSSGGGGSSYASVVGGLAPVAYWRLGESSGTAAADAAGSNQGTYGGSPTLGTAGLLTGDPNTAVRFDGVNDQVAVPSSSSLNPTSQLSIAAWVNADAWTRNPRIVQKGIDDTQYRLLLESGSLIFEIAGRGAVATSPPSAGARHFVVGTYDGSALRIYVDNVLRATTAATGAIPTTTEPLAIGNKPTSVDSRDPFAGVIDDVSIHASALSATQIGQLWTAGTNPPTGNQAPTAVASANPTNGPAPLTVTFNGTASSDPDPGDTLTYSWDLNGDGTFGDSTQSQPVFTYQSAGTYTAALRVTDNHGAPSTPATVPITVTVPSNSPPVPVIATPAAGTLWSVGEVISFSGSASDPEDGALAPGRLSWQLTIQHCPASCHPHDVETFPGVASGSFFAPDHEYPTYLELKLTATDSAGLAATVIRRLDPRTVTLSFDTVPSGLTLTVNGTPATTPFSKTAIEDSALSVSAPSPQSLSGATYAFQTWSDGGAATHTIVASQAAAYTATFASDGSQTVTLTTSADAEVRVNKRNQNLGASSTLRVRAAASRTYLQFAVPALAGPIQSATLRLYVTDESADPGGGGSAYASSNAWTETGITWTNAPPVTGSALSTANAPLREVWVEFDVTSIVVSGSTVTIVLADGSSDAVEYSSRTGGNAPQLVIVTGT